MPRFTTFPTLFDDLHSLTIQDFRRFGILGVPSDTDIQQVITWRNNRTKEVTANIRVIGYENCIEFDYLHNGEPKKYTVWLERQPSNLGRGSVNYFICPVTGNKCRKLYLYGGIFRSIKGCRGVLYPKQIESKRWRDMDKTYGIVFENERLWIALQKKHLKKTYKGKPTKIYSKLFEQYQRSMSVSERDFDNVMKKYF